MQTPLGVPNAAQPPRMSDFLRGISLEYTHEVLSRATREWNVSHRLGAGSYGAVYKGEMEDGCEVAIKVIDLGALRRAGRSPEMAGFEEEVQTLSKFRHPNLVTLQGWGKHGDYRYLVYELLSGGDVFDRLQKAHLDPPHPSHPFYWYDRLSTCFDAAKGLSHMHNSKPKAFHRDIKAANILLDRHGTAKMADFGLSCTAAIDRHVKVKNISGTPGYACPIYASTGCVTEGSEVYSFGMVMLEMLTGLAPATHDPYKPGHLIYPVETTLMPNAAGAVERCVRNADARGFWPAPLATELATLALQCVRAEEKDRPRFVDVVKSLRAMTERYPKPDAGVGLTLKGPIVSGADSPDRSSPVRAQEIPVATRSAEFVLELVSAQDLDLGNVPHAFRSLPLVPTASSSSPSSATHDSIMVAPVGRQHQLDFFNAWLADVELRNCISRTAFEVSWTAGAREATLTTRGANPVTVNGHTLARNESATLFPGSDVGFPYSAADEPSLFLQLRFQPASSSSAAFPEFPAETIVMAGVRATEQQEAKEAWYLECTAVDGLSLEDIAKLPQEVRRFTIPEKAPLPLGRQNQAAQFEALLSKTPASISFISRVHVSLEVQPGGDSLKATNVSSNAVYIDTKITLNKGESTTLRPLQDLSFARLEGTTRLIFLTLQVRGPRLS